MPLAAGASAAAARCLLLRSAPDRASRQPLFRDMGVAGWGVARPGPCLGGRAERICSRARRIYAGRVRIPTPSASCCCWPLHNEIVAVLLLLVDE